MSFTAIEILQQCRIEHITDPVEYWLVRIPPIDLEERIFSQVNYRLLDIGGKPVKGRINGYAFIEDPTNIMKQISGQQESQHESQQEKKPDQLNLF
jgi:hypothetical protein